MLMGTLYCVFYPNSSCERFFISFKARITTGTPAHSYQGTPQQSNNQDLVDFEMHSAPEP